MPRGELEEAFESNAGERMKEFSYRGSGSKKVEMIIWIDSKTRPGKLKKGKKLISIRVRKE